MLITTHELNASDVPYLYCSDPRVADEVEAVNRSLHRLDEGVSTWAYLEPEVAETAPTTGKEVAA